MGEEGKKLSKKEQKALEFKQRKKGLISEEEVQAKKKRKREEAEEKAETERKEAEEKKKQKKHRFILFVGNLPYNISEKSVEEHFKPAGPQAIRMRKGFAFAEFEGKDASKRMNIALRLHHTFINDRRINVELTAGGGGNTVHRKNKLRERNEKLRNEQAKRVRTEQTEVKKKKVIKSEEAEGVHPSRLALMD
jgi:nucleolar protein 6